MNQESNEKESTSMVSGLALSSKDFELVSKDFSFFRNT